ncbi:MAG: SMP-30/gluconolactonase/LRE family protein [Acidimicrobiales bacterium]|nr:SMP-30/gluconolactonase/LRE family protein [Hyphomonadaceae bacterium]RZV41199.1 MAG: SMP-30/gluconolactonase/LRE family protein [Acidimicrobiales bacterium]
MSLEFEEFASGIGFPEGPVAMKDGSVIFVDISGQTLSRVDTHGKISVIAKLPGGPNGTAIGPDGAAYICNNGGAYSFMDIPNPNPGENQPKMIKVPNPKGPPSTYKGGSIQRVNLETGAVKTLYDCCNGKPLLSPDDIVFDSKGDFWFTATGTSNLDVIKKGAVYYAKADGSLIVKAADVPTANGAGLSPDGKTLYVSDTLWGRLWAFEILGPGKLAPGPLPAMPGRVVQTLPNYQWVDSLKVEAGGLVCVGTLLFGGITAFCPTTGGTQHTAVPDLFTTNLCFGGEDMQDVYITASSTGRIYKTRWPRPGLKLAFNA